MNLPLKSITFAAPRAAKVDTNDTPAELPSGRVRFSDELGRETALVARREQQAASRARSNASSNSASSTDAKTTKRDAAQDPSTGAAPAPAIAPAPAVAADAIVHPGDAATDPAADPATDAAQLAAAAEFVAKTPPPLLAPGGEAPLVQVAAPKSDAARTAKRSDRKPVASESHADDEIALALAQLGLVVPAPSKPEPAPEIPSDPLLGTRVAAPGPAAETAEFGGAVAIGRDAAAAAAASAASRGDVGSAASARALRAALEKSVARDAAPSPKNGEDGAKAAIDLARLFGSADSTHAAAVAAAAGHAPVAATHALKQTEPIDPAAATRTADVLPRVALSELPRALPALLDELGPQMRLGKRGKNWEVEMRLDPPELGSLHIKFELHGDAIRGVVHCEPRVERLLEPVLKDLESQLNQQGGGASFDLSHHARGGEERASAARALRPDLDPVAALAPRASSRRSDPSRLVDVTA